MNPSINDYVVLNVAGKNYTVAIVNGKGKFNATGLNVGNYLVNVTYTGDYKYLPSSNDTVSLDVVAADLDASAIGLNVTVKENVGIVITVPGDFTGNVSVNVSGDIRYNDTVISLINIGQFKTGTYAANVTFYGDNNYNTKSVTVNFNVTRVTPSINVTIDDVTYPKDAVANIVIGNNANGTVNITVGKKTFIGTVENGVATVNLSKLSGGIHNATVEFFTGDDYNNNVTSTFVKFLVLPNNSLISIDGAKAIYVVGEDIDIKFNVINSTGKLDIYINGNYVTTYNSNPTIHDFRRSLGEGNYTITAVLDGDENYTGFTTSVSFKVVKNNLTISVNDTTNPATIVVGSPVTFTANLNASVTGDVIFTINGANYTVHVSNADKATYEYIPVNNATIKVVATFAGNDKYNSKVSAQKEFGVNRINTTMVIDVKDINYGQAANITVTITSDATGFITIRINETKSITLPIVKGKVNWIVEGLAADKYTVYANYSGDGKYNVNNTDKVNKGFEVKQISPDVEIIKVISESGKTATVIVKVDPRTTENVTLTVNNKPYSIKANENGIAVFTTDVLENGTYTAVASYAGDKNFTADTNSSEFTANKTSDYELNITAGDIEVDELTNITVNVPSDAKGKVIIEIDGVNYTATIKEGKAVFNNETGLGIGKYNITAYFGNDKYANKTATGVFYITRHATPISISVDPIKVGDKAVITVTVPNAVSGNVTIEIDGIKYNKSVDPTTGKAVFEVQIKSNGTRTVVASYAGDAKYESNSTTKDFTVTKRASQVNVTVVSPINVGDSTKVTVKVPVNATGYVVVNVNGNNYTVNLTDGEGSVEIAGLKNTTYKVTATYLGDDQYLSSINNTAVIKANKVASTINLTVARNGIIPNGTNMNITVKVPVDATGKVELTLLNGTKVVKTYTIYVNDGEGILHIYTPEVGVYNVTARYLGDDKYLASENRTSFEVYSTGGKLTVSAKNVDVDKNGTVTVTIVGNHEGEVTIIVRNATGELVRKNVTIIPGSEVSRAILTLPLLEAGTYDVEAVFAEVNGTKTTYHEGSTSFAVSKIASQIRIVQIDNSTVGRDVIIYLGIDLDEHARFGNITLLVNGHEYNTTVDNLEVHIPNLNATEYELEVTYHGNHWYDESSVHSHFTVEKNPISFVIEVPESKVGEIEHITVTLNEIDATGIILLDVDGKHLYANVSSHVARFNITGLKAGEYQINATYLGDYKYLANSTTAVLKITRTDTEASVKGTNITYGDDELIKFETAQNITSAVKVEIDGVNYTAFISEGKGNLTVRGLAAGKHNITLYVPQTEKYTAATAKANFTVSQGSADLSIEIANVTYGEVTTINAYVNATGTVTFEVEGMASETVDIINGVATLPVSGLGAGNYTVKATYNGNANVTTKEIESEFEVEKADPEITIDVENIVYGGVEYIVVHVNAEGNVTIKVDGEERLVIINGPTVVLLRASTWDVPDFEGKATLEVRGLDAGTYPVEVTYNGNENYNKATETAVFNVGKQNTTVDVEVEPSIKVGETQVINITVGNVNATGNVTINIGGVNYTAELANGRANFTTPKLAAGNHSVNVIYDGDKNLTGNWTSKTFEVTKLDAPVSVEIQNSTVGGKQTITVTVPQNATGQVLIDINDQHYYANVTDGKAVLELNNLPSDSYTVVATYLGDENYTAKSADSAAFKVNRNNSTVTVEAQNITYGDNEVIIFNVPEDATGNITVKVAGKTYTVAVSGGKGNLTVSGLHKGNYTVEAKYNGDDKYMPSNSTATFEVAKDTVEMEVIDKGNKTVVVVLPEDAKGNVTIKLGDETYNATIENGVAVITLTNATPGTHEINVTYSGDDDHDGQTQKATVHIPTYTSPIDVSVEDIKVGDKAVVVVTVPENATGNVTVEIDGVKYTTDNITDGVARFEIENLTAGTKTIAVDYAGDSDYASNHTTANITVSKHDSEVTFDVTLDGDTAIINVNAPSDVTRPVLVDVDGTGYYVNITDGKGQLVIPGISGGNHTVTARYLGDDKYNPSQKATKSFEVESVPSTVSVKVDNITYGDKAVVEVTVPTDATGNVTVTIGNKTYTVPVSGGKGVLVVPDLDAGNYTVEAKYNGDDKYESSTYSTALEVAKEILTPEDVKVIDQGNGTVVVVVPENATGNVTVKVGDKEYNATVVNGTAVITLDNSTPGTHEVEVIYSGDDNHDGVGVKANVTAPKRDAPIEIEVGEAKEGEPVEITVTVPENATGNVTISVEGKDYTAPIKDGKATFTVPELTDGDKTIAVGYEGDDNYAANNTVGNFTVEKAPVEPDMKVVDYGNGTVVVVGCW